MGLVYFLETPFQVLERNFTDITQAGTKVGANASKVAGRVIIVVSAVFLTWDIYDLYFTIRGLLNEKGSDAVKALRAKADELDKICSCY